MLLIASYSYIARLTIGLISSLPLLLNSLLRAVSRNMSYTTIFIAVG